MYIPFFVFALLFSLPPSRNSDPGSLPMMGARAQEIATLCCEGKAQIVQTNIIRN